MAKPPGTLGRSVWVTAANLSLGVSGAQSRAEAPSWDPCDSGEGRLSLVPETQVWTGSAGPQTGGVEATRGVRGWGGRRRPRNRPGRQEPTCLYPGVAAARLRAEGPLGPSPPGKRGGSSRPPRHSFHPSSPHV